ncbi:MAG: transposase [Prevotellaceae bacterium]|jgi:hypothetical protein|nr:transposase [Prevotellaceae bacterium]
MSTKISNLSELTSILTKKEKRDTGVLVFSRQFKIGQLLKPFSGAKKQGKPILSVLVLMLLSRLGGMSINGMQQTGHLGMDENTVYRLMNNPLVDWKSILLTFSRQFLRCVLEKGESDKRAVKCFVIDDTDIEKTGKTFEGISKIFSHVSHGFLFGYKMLTLCLWDGKSLIPCCLSLHRESKKNEYGLNKKQQLRQFRKERKAAGYFKERYEELDEEKSKVAVKMLKRAVRSNILASYVLMDSWFVSDYMLQSIRAIRGGLLHVVGMCKMDKRKFKVGGKEYNSQTVIKMNETKKEKVHLSRKYHSKYMMIVAGHHGTQVKLFYIKYKNAKNWTLLLTTDLSLSFARAMELYQIRWSIEVMYKECKQYLRLGKAQNTDFYGQIADATLTLITYTILTLYKRFEAYETLGALFRDTQGKMLEKTLCERIAIVFIKIVAELLEILSLDVEECIRRIIVSKQGDRSVIILLNAISQLDTECETSLNVA